jgi:hypothetical protein
MFINGGMKNLDDKMLIIKADEVTPEQLFKLVDSVQRFTIENIGLDKEILGHSIANRILNADDPFDELKYYQDILDDVGNVLYCRRETRI